MRYLSPITALLALSLAVPAVATGQAFSGLTVTNYQLVSQQQVTRNQTAFVYRADLVNNGVAAQPSLTAIVTSKVASIVATPGLSNLHFPPVLPGKTVTSTNTFTVTVDRSLPSDFSNLVWTFGAPVANAGPDQTVPVGTVVTLDGTRTTNPSGSGAITFDWLFESRVPGTRAVLQGSDTPMPFFTADVQGDFVLKLRATNSFGTDISFVTVHVGPATAQKPTANAGPGQTVKPVGATVTLNGSGSTDPGGNPLTYKWSLIVRPPGSAATLSSTNTVITSFIADKPGTYMAQLIVNNGTLDSDPSIVTITDVNTPPIANPGSSQNVTAGATVQLNGSGSTDFDGNPLTYHWTLNSIPAGSTATLSNANIVNPTFVADLAGIYVAQLIVNDGFDDSKPVTVTITAGSVAPQKPTANAGLPISTKHNLLVTLNGSGTDPQGKPLTFRWSLITKPVGSVATLSNPNSPNPTFNADVPGTFVAQLIVNNGTLDSDPSTVQISSTNTAPVANAGPNQSVSTGTKVILDGTASSDAESDALTYSWSLSSVPAGSTATLNLPTTAHPTFVADLAGTYVAQLVVNDGYLSSSPATVTITAISSGLVLSPNPLNLLNLPGTLTVSIGSPAGSLGQVVNLTSFDTTVVTVPPSVTIAPNTTSVAFTVTPTGTGTTNVIASASGFQPGSTTVNVTQPLLSISLSSNTVGVSRSVTGTVTLNAQAPPGGVSVNLTADRNGIVTIPNSLTITGGNTTGTFTVTGAGVGSTNITASSPGYTSRSVGITVGQLGQITLASNVTVGPSQTLPYGVSLVSPAPSGGVTINLSSSDTSKLTISPSVFIAAGATTPDTAAQITGVNFGSVTITASASGFTGDSKTVQVAANLSFTPAQLTIGVGGTQNLTLTLSGPAPTGGLLVNLSSSNTNAATVPANVTIQQGATTANVPLTGVTAGQSTTITASSSTPGVVSGTASVSVIPGVVISTSTLPNGATGTPYNATVTASGGTAPYSFTATGLPGNLSISQGGQITGTPNAAGTFTVAVTVTDSTSPKLTANANLTLVINQALAITTTTLPAADASSPYSATVAATGGTNPYTFTATGLPSGLSISAGGQITGTTTLSGSFPITVTVTDSTSPKLTASANLTLVVNPALAITTTSLPAATSGTPYTATVGATGGKAPYSFTATGLPSGLSISAGGQITGTSNTTGNFTPVFTVTDATAPNPFSSNATLALSVVPPALVLSTTSLPGATVNTPYSASVIASGGTSPYTFSATGVPAGLTFNSAGQISGTPSAAGAFTLSVTVTDVSSPAMSKTGNVTLTINPPGLALVTSSLPNGTMGTSYSASVNASGGTMPYNFTATGVPAGLTLSTGGQLSGTPTASGSFTLNVTVTDAGSPVQTKTGSVTIQIDPSQLVLTSTSLPSGTVGTSYTAALTASGGTGAYSFAATGVPAGLVVNGTGHVSGNPTASGPFTLSVTVTDSGSPAQTKTGLVTIQINPSQLVLTSTTLPNGTVGTAYSASLTASGGTLPYTFNATGVPAGLAVNAAGQVTGNPTASGPFTLTVTVSDNSTPAQTKTGPVTFQIAPSQLVLTSTSLPGGTVGVAYSAALTASGGTGAYNFSATGVPAGLAVNAAGQVTGNPATAGAFTLTVTVTDSGSPAQTKTGPVTISIAPPPLTITTASLPSGMVGVQYTAQVNAGGGIAPYSFAANGLPAGLTLSLSGQITGSPTASGNFNVTFTVADSNNPRQTASANLTINITPQQTGPSLTVTGGAIGQNLQIPITITLTTASQSSLSVMVSSDNPNVLLGGQSKAGTQSFTVTLAAGSTSFTTFAKSSVASGSATITAVAGGYNNGTATVTLTPSGFVIAGPNGVGASFNSNQGAITPLTVSAAQLDSSGNVGQIEQLSGGLPAAVTLTLSNSNSSAGNVSPASVSISPGTDSATTQFTASSSSTATTLITVNTPSGFSTSTANSVAISVLPSSVTASNVTVGHGLQNTAAVSLQGVAPTNLNVVLTSSDPSKVLLSLDGVSAGQPSITTMIGAGRSRTLDFYVYGVGAAGNASYTAAVDGFPTTNGLVTIANSGFILSGPFGLGADFFTTTLSDPSEIDVFTAVLDGSGNPTISQAVAGGTTVSVNVTSSSTGVGTITTSPVVFTGGTDTAITQFQPKAVGTTTLAAVAPAGYSTPIQDATLHANVSKPKVVVQNIDVLGNNLEVQTTFFLSAPAPAGGVTVTLQSSDAALLQFSSTATGAGTGTLQIPVLAGQSGVSFFAYGKSGTGTPTYSASALGYDPTTASVTLASSGIIIYGPSGPTSTAGMPAFEFDTSVAAGPSPLSVSTAVLDGTGNYLQTQPLQGGTSVTVSLNNTNPAAGTITTPVTITAGNDTTSSIFTPQGSGQQTTVSVARPLNFSPASNNTSILVKVQ